MRRKSFTNRLLAVVLASAMLISTIAPSKAYAADALVQAENSDAGSSANAAVQEDDNMETAVQTDNSKQKKSVDAAPSDGTSDTNVEEDAEDYSVRLLVKMPRSPSPRTAPFSPLAQWKFRWAVT